MRRNLQLYQVHYGEEWGEAKRGDAKKLSRSLNLTAERCCSLLFFVLFFALAPFAVPRPAHWLPAAAPSYPADDTGAPGSGGARVDECGGRGARCRG